MRGGRLVEWRGAGSGPLVRGVAVSPMRRRGDVRGPPRCRPRGARAAGTAGRATRGGEETRRDVVRRARRDGEARARSRERQRARSRARRRPRSGDAWRSRPRGRARSRRYADGWTPRGSSPRWREGQSIDGRARGSRERRRGLPRGKERGGSEKGRVSVVVVQTRGGSWDHERRGRIEAAAPAPPRTPRGDRRGDVRVGVGLTIASDDADSRERVSRSARRIRPCPPTIARGKEYSDVSIGRKRRSISRITRYKLNRRFWVQSANRRPGFF